MIAEKGKRRRRHKKKSTPTFLPNGAFTLDVKSALNKNVGGIQGGT
jgi:hypothetical protein